MVPSAAVAPAVSQLPPVQRKHVANLVILKNLLAALPQAEAIVTPTMLERHYQSQKRKTSKKERHLRQRENEEGDAYTLYEDDYNDGGDEYNDAPALPPQVDALLAALTSPDAIAFYASQISDNVFDVISSALELPPPPPSSSSTAAHRSFSSSYTSPAHPSRPSLTGDTAAAGRHEGALNILTLVAAAFYSQRCWTEICGVGASMRNAPTGMMSNSTTGGAAGGRPRVGVKGLHSSFPTGHSFIPSSEMDMMTPEEIARRINKVISEDYVPLARVLIGTLAKLSAGGGGGLTSPTLPVTTTSYGSGAPIVVTIHSNNSSVSVFPETLKSIRNSSVMNLGTKGTVLLIEAVSPQALPQQATSGGSGSAAISSSSTTPTTGCGAPSAPTCANSVASPSHISPASSTVEMEANFSKFFKDMWIAHGTAAKLRGEQHQQQKNTKIKGAASSGSPAEMEVEEKKENGKDKEESSHTNKGGVHAHIGGGIGSAKSRAIEILDASISSFALTGALSPAVGSPLASISEPFPNPNTGDGVGQEDEDNESSHAATLLLTLAPPVADLLSILQNVQLKFKEHYDFQQQHRKQQDGEKDAHHVSASACECALRVAMADWLTASMAVPSVAGSSSPTAPGGAAATTTSAATRAVCEFLLRAAVPTTLTNEVLGPLRASEREEDGKELFCGAHAAAPRTLSSFDMSLVASRIADEDQEVLERCETAAHDDDNNNDLAFYSGSRLIKRCATFLFLQHYLNPEDFLPDAVISMAMDVAEAEQRYSMQKMQCEQEGRSHKGRKSANATALSSAANPPSSSAASSKEASTSNSSNSNSSNQVYTSSGVAAAKRRRAEIGGAAQHAVIIEVKDEEEEDGEGDREEQVIRGRVAGQKHSQRSSTIGGGGSCNNASSNAAANKRESSTLNLRKPPSAASIVPPSVHLACHFPHLHAFNAFVSRVTVRSYFYLARCSSAGSPLGVVVGGHESGSNSMTIHTMVAKLLAGPCLAMLLGSDDCERFLLASGATSPSESASLKAAAIATAVTSNDANKTAKSEKKSVVKSESVGDGNERDSKSLRYSGPSSHLSKAEAYSRVCTRDFLLRLVNQFEACEGAAIFKDPVYPSTIMNHSGAQLGPYSMVIRTPMSLAMLRLCIMGGGGDGGFAGGKGLSESVKPTSPTSATPGKAKAAFPIATLADLRKGLWLIAANCTLFNAPEGPFPEKSRAFVNLCCKIIDEAAAIMMTI